MDSLGICFVLYAGPEMASTRYRAIVPGKVLGRRGYHVIAGEPDPNFDVFVFSKHFNPVDPETATVLKQKGKTIIYDVCDYHFEGKHRDHYLRMCDLAHVVTCTTEQMREYIKEFTDRDAEVIPDPVEFPVAKPRFDPEDPVRLFWYGNLANLDTLEPIIPQIEGLTLTVVTNRELEFNRTGSTYCRAWSPKAMFEGYLNSDIVIVPTINDNRRKLVKSHNRVSEAIRQGHYVCAGPLPSYEQFAPWMYIGDIRKGIDWALEHPDQVRENIATAQDYVADHFDPEVIGSRWEETIKRSTSQESPGLTSLAEL